MADTEGRDRLILPAENEENVARRSCLSWILKDEVACPRRRTWEGIWQAERAHVPRQEEREKMACSICYRAGGWVDGR